MAANPSIQLGTDGNWAIKEDNLLAYKKDGTRFFNKEFDFTRGTFATFVDKDGLIKVSGFIDTELVTNGNFDTDSDWTKDAGWTISNGEAIHTGSGSYISQTGTTIGKNYRVVIEVTQASGSGFPQIYMGGLTTAMTSAGTYTFYITATSTLIRLRGLNDCKVTSISVKEIQTDVPRIDFTDDATGHLLLEPQSTNLITNSEDFSGWALDDVTVESDSDTSPDGNNKATLIKGNTNSSRHHIRKTLSGTVDGSYSVFAKAKELRYLQIASINTTNQYVNFDLQDGLVGTVGSDFSNAKIEVIGSGWYRLSVTSDDRYNSFYISLVSGTNATWLESWVMSNNTDGLYIWGAQLEQQSFATSYIPTDGFTATRNADVCNNSGSAQDFNSEEGVIYADIAALQSTSSGSKFIAISDETYNNRASILFSNSSTNQIRCFLRVGGVSQVDKSTNVTDVTDFNKVAFSFKENEFKVFINGSQAGSTDTSGSVWTSGTITKLSLTEINSALGAFNGKTKNLKVFKRAMSDGELYLLTVTQYQSYQEMATALNYTL